MDEGVHRVEEGVNLTMNLMKAFDITYVRLKFSSPRPETFVIYKKNRREPWKPVTHPSPCTAMHSFARTRIRRRTGCHGSTTLPTARTSLRECCRSCSHGLADIPSCRVPDLTSIIQPRAGPSGREQRIGEDRALCTSELSDISPLTGGSVAFSTLEGRPGMDLLTTHMYLASSIPGAYNFDHNQELQHWVVATDIRSKSTSVSSECHNIYLRISLMRLNTFGDEVFGDQKVPPCALPPLPRCCGPTTTESPILWWAGGASVTGTPTSAS
jgi:coxsackievirus/adenovirus receptor